MATKRKTSRKKTVKQRKYRNSIVITLLLIIFYFIFWSTKNLYFYTRKNTLFFVGSLLFIISFLFVSFNALFSQKTHQNILTQMKFSSTQSIGKSSNLSERETKSQELSRVTSLHSPSHHHTNSPFSPQSESMIEKQKKLAELGLYDGPLDGLDGPKMRRAIALWKQQATQKKQNDILSNPTTDEIAILIKQSEIEIENNTTTKNITNSKESVLNLSVEDILQVQKALHNFGHEEVLITGIEDQKTIEALKQFQKMFDLPVTGKINHTILMKMREIGLLN